VTSERTITRTYDPGVGMDEADQFFGPGGRRYMELLVVDEVIDLPLNRNRLRRMVARSLGYDDLAEYLEDKMS
jgi:hypothetical protein